MQIGANLNYCQIKVFYNYLDQYVHCYAQNVSADSNELWTIMQTGWPDHMLARYAPYIGPFWWLPFPILLVRTSSWYQTFTALFLA